MPPLIVEKQHLDQFVDALDDLLNTGFTRIVAGFIAANVRDRLPSGSDSVAIDG